MIGKMVVDLKALPVPPFDEKLVADIFVAVDAQLAKLIEMRDAAAGKDFAHVIAASKEVSPLATAADAKLDAYGLKTCGSNFGDA